MKKCPLCDGCGFITRKKESVETIDKVKQILEYREQGLSMQEIGGLVGLSSNTVHYHINKHKSAKSQK